MKVADSEGRGRGVFSTRAYRRGEVIETCPVILIPHDAKRRMDPDAIFYSYSFSWKNGDGALALGMGTLMNHSFSPNVTVSKDFERGMISFIAHRDISPGEELMHNYLGAPDARGNLIFTPF